MTKNHLKSVVDRLMSEATRLNADELGGGASTLRDAISVLEEIPCRHSPRSPHGGENASCLYCEATLVREWVAAAEEADVEDGTQQIEATFDGYTLKLLPNQEGLMLPDSQGRPIWWVSDRGWDRRKTLPSGQTAYEARGLGWRPAFEVAGEKCPTCQDRPARRCGTCGRDYARSAPGEVKP